MNIMSFIHNISLLMVITIPLKYFHRRFNSDETKYKVLIGTFFGLAAIVGMMFPMVFTKGIVFDARSVLGSIAGLYAGPIAGAIFIVITGAYRIHMGGAGATMGVSVIITSALVGVVYRHLRRNRKYTVKAGELFVLGLINHLFMLMWTMLLPANYTIEVYHVITIPVLTLFPLGTVILGRLMADDIEHVKAERDLLQSESKYRELVENASSIIMKVDTHTGNIIFMNEFGLEFFGYAEEEVLGRKVVGTIIPEVDSSGVDLKVFVEKILENASRFTINENENMCKDGRRVWITWRNKPIYDSSGKQIELHCVGIDTTEKKKAETELQSLRDNLEVLVAQKTEELKNAHEKLIKTERLAVLGEFAGSVAHEIRNPLAAIGTSSYLIKQKLSSGKCGEDIASHIHSIEDQIKKCAAIIDSIIRISKSDKPNMERVDVAGFVKNIVMTKKGEFGGAVNIDLPEGALYVKADKGQLEIAMKNVIDNAFQAMGDEGVMSVSIAERSQQEGRFARIEISDTGVGISEKNLPNIFDPLFSTKSIGIGFGLSIVKMIVERHSGRIYVESAENKGTSFIVELPVV